MDAPESPPSMGPVCPWCSGALTLADQPACPSCGANLAGDPEVEIEGVTALDADTRLRLGLAQRAANPPARRGLLAWMGGDPEPELVLDAETAAILGGASIEPPSDDVRREMLRLELEDLQRELERAAAEQLPEGLMGAEGHSPSQDARGGDAGDPDAAEPNADVEPDPTDPGAAPDVDADPARADAEPDAADPSAVTN